MSVLSGQFPRAAEQVRGDAVGKMEVWRERDMPGGRLWVGPVRRALGLTLTLVLVLLLAMPPLAPAAAVPRFTPFSASDVPGDEYWAAGFNLPGMNSDVLALAVGPDGSLYAGGQFTTAGGIVANRIARWDGSRWHPLGSGMDGSVSALALGPGGSLYAGGSFTTAGGVVANDMARWDGSQWHPLGNGMEDYSYLNALAVGPDGSLYAGGSFTMAGGVAANRIARWDGSRWHALGSGTDGSVGALAFAPDGSLYVGGHFTTAGNKPSWKIAQWIREVLMSPVAWFPVVHIDQ